MLQERKNIGGFRYFQKLSPPVKRSLTINLLGPHRKLRLNILGNGSVLVKTYYDAKSLGEDFLHV